MCTIDGNSTSTLHPQVASNEPLLPTLDSSRKGRETNIVTDEVEINSDENEELSTKNLISETWKHFQRVKLKEVGVGVGVGVVKARCIYCKKKWW